MNASCMDQFRRTIEADGLLPTEIIPDGAIYRCPTVGHPRSKKGAYLLYPDCMGGGYQLWTDGPWEDWRSDAVDKLPPAEKKAFRERTERDRKARQAAQAEVHQEAAAKAQAIFTPLAKATADNCYLKRKGVAPVGDLRVTDDGVLVIPVLAKDGKVHSNSSRTMGKTNASCPA